MERIGKCRDKKRQIKQFITLSLKIIVVVLLRETTRQQVKLKREREPVAAAAGVC